MDCWMDGFWPWSYLRWARLGGSRSARPSTIFPTSFDIDFLTHFGMELALIFDTFWTFVHHFCFKTSTIEKTLIFIKIPWTNGALEPWKIQLLRGTLWKKHRNRKFRFYTILVFDLGCILASCPGPLAMIFDMFSSLIFACFFVNIFGGARHQHGSQLAPQMDQEFQKKRNWCSPLPFGSTRRQFDSVLGPLWSPFGTFWAPVGHHLGSILVRIIYY